MARHVGDVEKLQVTFRDEEGAVADPDTVKLYLRKLRTDDFVTYTFGTGLTIEQVSEGVYKAYIPLDVPETWLIGWEGTGTIAEYEEAEFYVSPQRAVEIVP